MAAKSLHFSTSGRTGYILTQSAFCVLLFFVLNILYRSFVALDFPDFLVIAASLLIFAFGVVLLIRDPLAKRLGWRLLVQVPPLGDRTTHVGYIITTAASLFICTQIFLSTRPYYLFEANMPLIIIGHVLYAVGLMLVLRPPASSVKQDL